jgi:endonuclease YncB( thermonuclease family)
VANPLRAITAMRLPILAGVIVLLIATVAAPAANKQSAPPPRAAPRAMPAPRVAPPVFHPPPVRPAPMPMMQRPGQAPVMPYRGPLPQGPRPGLAPGGPHPGFVPPGSHPGSGPMPPGPHPGPGPTPPQPLQQAGPGRGLPIPETRPLGTPIRLDPRTSIAPHIDRSGFTATRKTPDGHEIVMEHRVGPGGRPQTTAFLQHKDLRTGLETRTYLDGTRVTFGRDFVTRSGPRGLTVLTRHDGLREVSLRDRRVLFDERFGLGPHNDRRLMRTVHTAMIGGAMVTLGAPLVQSFTIVHYHGVEIYPYVPVEYAPAWYDPFFGPLPAPIVVGPDCPFCPPPVIAFAAPVTSYSDVNELLGDMVLASAVQENIAVSTAAPPPAADPDVTALAAEAATLQQQLATAGTSNEALRGQPLQLEELQLAKPPPAPAPDAKMSVPEDVRHQVHQEVKQCLALRRENKPLSLAELIASSDAQKYVFQVSELIGGGAEEEVFHSVGALIGQDPQGASCALATGDLAVFASVPGENDATATMRVVASKTGNCPVGSTVKASLADLQEMLNGFERRLEDGMTQLHDHLAAAGDTPSGDAPGAKPDAGQDGSASPPASPKPSRPPLKGTVAGVVDAATLVVGQRQVKLQGVEPGPQDVLGPFAIWVHSRSPVECQEEQDHPGLYHCVSNNGVDVGEAAILNGVGKAGVDASALYKQRESEARQAQRGLWKAK